jgi:hypothetical protein
VRESAEAIHKLAGVEGVRRGLLSGRQARALKERQGVICELGTMWFVWGGDGCIRQCLSVHVCV